MNQDSQPLYRRAVQKPVGLFVNNPQKYCSGQALNFPKLGEEISYKQSGSAFYNPAKTNVCAVKSLKKNFKPQKSGVEASAFNVTNNSCQILDAVRAFKNLSLSNSGLEPVSLSCKSILQPRNTPGSTSTLPTTYISLQKSSQRLSIDSTKSITSGVSGMNIDLPDGAEASDIKGQKAFEDLSEDSEKSSKSIPSSPTKRFGASTHLRKDVVWKGLLRNMKKYYSSQFKNYFNYSDQKFIKKSDCRQIALEKAKEFAAQIFPEESAEIMGHFLLALLDAKQKLYVEKETFPQLSEKICGLLRSFTSRKLRDLLTLHQFSNLVLHFLESKSDLMDLVKRPQDNSENIELYQGYISSLTALAAKSINQ